VGKPWRLIDVMLGMSLDRDLRLSSDALMTKNEKYDRCPERWVISELLANICGQIQTPNHRKFLRHASSMWCEADKSGLLFL
jgi:hypothetical protein